jgi:hypothetical protein
MDIVNFPGIIAEHGLLTSAQVSLAKDLILIGKQMGPQRDGTQYENMAITVAQFANLVSGGGNETLAQTLALGNVTGGNNIFISNGDNIVYNSGAFTGTLSDPVLAGNVVWTLPSTTGTIALLSDIPGAPDLATVLSVGNVTGGNNIVVDSNDSILLYDNAGGTGVSQILWNGLNYIEYNDSGNALMEIFGGNGIYLNTGVAAYSYSTNGVYEINSNGAPIPIIAFSTSTTNGNLSHLALTGARTWDLPNQSGTIALLSDIPAAPTTIYTGNGTIGSTRTATLTDSLTFQHATGGYFYLEDGGNLSNHTLNIGTYFDYNYNNAVFTFHTGTALAMGATVTGTRMENTGGVGNPDSLVELFAGSNGRAYLNIGPTTGFFDFYVNNTAKYAGGILGGSGAFNGSWGFGVAPTTGAKVYILSENGQGFGTVIATSNLSPAEAILQVRDASNTTRFGVSATGRSTVNGQLWVGSSLGSVSSAATLVTKGADSSFLTKNTEFTDGSNNSLWVMQNNGNIGHNIAPNALDRMYIRAGSGYDGAININAQNVADNGYGILLQGGTAVANYNGVWSDVTAEGTGINRAFRGSSLLSGGASNYGGYFVARNGTSESIGVYGLATGGDSVNSTDSVGVLGVNASVAATSKKGVWGYIINNVDNGTGFGGRFEAANAGLNAVNYASWNRANGAGATITNTAIYAIADGGLGALNNAIISAAGFNIFGALVNINGSLVEVSGDVEVIGTGTGFILESPDTTRWRIAVSNLGVLSAAAA